MKNTIILIFLSFIYSQTVTITGTVIQEETGTPLQGVNIRWGTTGVATDRDGRFSLSGNRSDSLIVSHIGYKTRRFIMQDSSITIPLAQIVLESPVIEVEAVRAVEGITPVTFSTLTREEIKLHYSVQDVPMALATEPGVYAYSESGNGTGYSYVSIRGFDQSRISVMIDNVPLNDNESFQVYWVDHGDILAQAEDVQIQRGLGMGIIGSSSFGGTINLRTGIRSAEEKSVLTLGGGSYATTKTRFQYSSGGRFGEKTALGIRASQIESAGYRKFHDSFQRTGFLGLDRNGDRWSHRLRMIIGKEITDLSWDGISSQDINDRRLRRAGNRAYTDDFLQSIFSLNSEFRISPEMRFRNTIYQVRGKGFYRVRKSGVDYYSYNLDWNDSYPDSIEQSMTLDLTRRKWIVNQYLGWNPIFTWMRDGFRFDGGMEVRNYQGNHYGEVNDF
ncbi:MAG: TonB-dependent receptor plug domain-containing protein, partial [Fidelibacterota bacterium]